MNKQKAMMDKLMGISRDKAASEKTGLEFNDPVICKHHLTGFCPDGLIGRQVQKDRNPLDVTDTMPVPCTKTHSNAMKAEFEVHADVEKWRKKYEASLLRRLEEIVSECDRRVFFGKKKCEPTREPEFKLPDSKLEAIYVQYKAEKDAFTKEAADKGEAGDVAGSQAAIEEVKIAQKKIDVIVETHTEAFPGEGCCDICATKYLLGPKRVYTHGQKDFTGWISEEEHPKDKTHLAYVEIREWLVKLQEKSKNAKQDKPRSRSPHKRSNETEGSKKTGADNTAKEKTTEKSKSPGKRAGTKDKSRDRSKARRGSPTGKRAKDKSRDRSRSHGGTRNGKRAKEKSRDRSKSRGGGRSGKRAKDKSRDRSRSRRRASSRARSRSDSGRKKSMERYSPPSRGRDRSHRRRR